MDQDQNRDVEATEDDLGGSPAVPRADVQDEAVPGRTRGRRLNVVGTVVSDKMTKTIAVREERRVKHPLYGKYVGKATVYKAHDEEETAHEGDRVEIAFTRPLSKTKSWRLVRVIRRAKLPAGGPVAREPSEEVSEAEAGEEQGS